VQEWYVEQVRAAEKVGEEARAKLKTKADAEAYIRGVCDKIAKCFGEFPEKTPLNRDTYTIEKVIFESRPGFFATANLYLKARKARARVSSGRVGTPTTARPNPPSTARKMRS
jgi:hypothetical protein